MADKGEVLSLLENNRGENISGSEIARNLGISRAAVWKHIKALRADGFEIYAATNKGYTLNQDSDKLSVKGIQKYINSDIENKIYVYNSVSSTNELAKQLAISKDAHGAVIVANAQEQGKGRLGRSFFSPADTGIYMSIILKPNFKPEHTQMLTAAAAVAVCRALAHKAAVDAKIKWVNDIFIDSKKVCGILTEASFCFESKETQFVVIGIGINVKTAPFPEEISEIAGSVGTNVTRNELIAAIINEFFAIYNNFLSFDFVKEYKDRSNIVGKEVYLITNGNTEKVKVMLINNLCQLVVVKAGGEIKTLSSGEVSIKL